MYRELRKNCKDRGIWIRILKLLLFIYVLFPFRLKTAASVQAYMLYAIEFVLMVLFLGELYKNKLSRKVLFPLTGFIVFFFSLMIIAFCLPIIRNTGDLTYFLRYITILKKMIVIFGLAYLCDDLEDFFRLFIAATTLYVLITIVMLIPGIHAMYSDMVVIPESSLSDYEYLHSSRYYTRIGLQGFSGFGWTFRCTLSVGICCCEYIMKKLNFSISKIIFYGVINLLGTFFYGRTGTIIAIFCIIFTAFYQLFIQGKGYLVFWLCAAVMISIIVFIYNIDFIQKSASLSWIFEGFLNIVRSGKFSTDSGTYIMDKMIVKMSLNTFLFGDARYTASSGLYYMGTDLGIMRPLLFWGIGGQIIYYVMPLILLFPIKRYLGGKHGVFFLGIMVLILFGFECKGEINLEYCIILFAMYLAMLRGFFKKYLRVKFK